MTLEGALIFMPRRANRPRAENARIPMQVTETLNEGLKRGYTIVVPAKDLDEKVNEKLAEAAPEIEMKGFRKGKVPMALLKKQFGGRLMGEAMQESVECRNLSFLVATSEAE